MIAISEKITVIPYVEVKCRKCGRDLPRGRKVFCKICMPPHGRKNEYAEQAKPELMPGEVPEYTIEDRVAQAQAHGLSYGNLMAKLENGWPLPPLLHPVRWPAGSAHGGK